MEMRCDALRCNDRRGRENGDNSRLMQKRRQVFERSGLAGDELSSQECRLAIGNEEWGGWFFGMGDGDTSSAPLSPGRRAWATVRGACGDLDADHHGAA